MAKAIVVENISKQYRLGQIGTGALTHDINRWWHKVRGKEDPYLKIGETNDRTTKGSSDYVWSLRDINFDIEQGDSVGIIGRNGAGKSTLLKILSRVTAPTTGTLKVKGRIASLLEVGTGFHPELSGRDNIFLNGAILGMRKHEIKRKFDEIVDFAGVERYIDTPVKRYSSGMYVRLAFAVAAHLESEILIVDEVLAVGDAEFQKRCLKRMSYVSKQEGRTILFVSHDLKAVGSLCDKSILLKNGVVKQEGATYEVIKEYVLERVINRFGQIQVDKNCIEFKGIANQNELTNLKVTDDVSIKLVFDSKVFSSNKLLIDFAVFNERNEMIIHSKTKYLGKFFTVQSYQQYILDYQIISPNLAPGSYNLTIYIYDENQSNEAILWIDEIPAFSISAHNPYPLSDSRDYLDEVRSYIFPKTNIELKTYEKASEKVNK